MIFAVVATRDTSRKRRKRGGRRERSTKDDREPGIRRVALLAAACQDVASAGVGGGQIVGDHSLDESVPANATYLVEVSLEKIVESGPVDLVDVSLDESFEEFSVGGKERDRLAADTKRRDEQR